MLQSSAEFGVQFSSKVNATPAESTKLIAEKMLKLVDMIVQHIRACCEPSAASHPEDSSANVLPWMENVQAFLKFGSALNVSDFVITSYLTV